MKLLLTTIAFSLFTNINTTHAGVNISGGGHGVVTPTGLHLLDFVEHGIEDHLIFVDSSEAKIEDGMLAMLRFSVPDLPIELLAVKISDIGRRDPVLAMAIQKTIVGLTWSLTKAPLKFIDPETTINADIIQIAARTSNHVVINNQEWEKLNNENKVALFIHEAVAALADKKLLTAFPARTLTANLFDGDYQTISPIQIQNDLTFFPSLTKMAKLSPTAMQPSEILYSYSDRLDLLFPGQTHTPKRRERPVDEYRFIPTLKITSAKNSSEVIVVTPQTVQKTIARLNFCEDSKGIPVSIEAGYHTVETKMDDEVTNGSPWPRFLWSVLYRPRAIIQLDGICSAANKVQVQALQKWFKKFSSPLQ